MKFFAFASFLGAAVATAVPRQSCSEADRYGVLKESPSTITTGAPFSITADFTCAEVKNRWPVVGVDYYVRSAENIPGTDGQAEFFLTHRTLPDETAHVDSFETTLAYDPVLDQTVYPDVEWNLILHTNYGNPPTWGEAWYPVTIAN